MLFWLNQATRIRIVSSFPTDHFVTVSPLNGLENSNMGLKETALKSIRHNMYCSVKTFIFFHVIFFEFKALIIDIDSK